MVKNLLNRRHRRPRRLRSIPILRRSSGAGNSNPLQCSCQGNPMDRGMSHSPWSHKQSHATEHAHMHAQVKAQL